MEAGLPFGWHSWIAVLCEATRIGSSTITSKRAPNTKENVNMGAASMLHVSCRHAACYAACVQHDMKHDMHDMQHVWSMYACSKIYHARHLPLTCTNKVQTLCGYTLHCLFLGAFERHYGTGISTLQLQHRLQKLFWFVESYQPASNPIKRISRRII